MPALQVREGLLDPYFHQWLRDTEELLEKLPQGLEAPEQSLGLSLTFERWLLQLKVCPALQTLICSPSPIQQYEIPGNIQPRESLCLSTGLRCGAELVLTGFVPLQGLQRLLLFGFPSDAKSLESIPQVGQVTSSISSALHWIFGLLQCLALGDTMVCTGHCSPCLTKTLLSSPQC